jgi:glycosyltransferase involved in cell wall biosynthesis
MVKSVLLLLPGAFSGIGGIEMYNRQLVRAFLELGEEHGFRVRTLVLNDRTEDVDDRYIPRGAVPPVGYARRRSAFGAAALWNVIRSKPDIILLGHVHFARIAPLLKLLSPRSRHWYVVHGIEVWRPLSYAIRRGLSLADEVFSVSDFSRRELSKNGGPAEDRIKLLPCALDPVWQAQYAPRPDEPAGVGGGRRVILTVARLAESERHKGLDSVIRALPEIAKEVPDVVYEIVGDGDDRYRLETLARELGVAERVRFRGRLGPDQLAAAYRDCAVFVMPSSKEGFGIVFLEAALFEKPSIGGRHGGTPEVVEHQVTGLLVDREDYPGLARSAVRLLSNADERRVMGAAARARLTERFSCKSFRLALARELVEADCVRLPLRAEAPTAENSTVSKEQTT